MNSFKKPVSQHIHESRRMCCSGAPLINYKEMLKVIFLLFNDLIFKIIIKLVIDHY
jgi:hypothetical protein